MKRKSQRFSKKNKPSNSVNWSLAANTNIAQKGAFAEVWLKELRYHKYRYNVETCNDGSLIYLTRPTPKNKGVDFQVKVAGFRSAIRKTKSERPSHDDVKHDLKSKLDQLPDLKEDLFAALSDVYDCIEPEEAIRRHSRVKRFSVGLQVDKTLRIIKWLFIEQDITYWLGTGRDMLMSSIEEEVFGIDADLYE